MEHQILTAILTSFIGGAFSLLSIYLTHYLQRQGHSPVGAYWKGAPKASDIHATDIRQRLKYYRQWFWRTVLLAIAISIADWFAPLIGYILHEYLVILLLVPVYVLQTYFLVMYFNEALQYRALRRSSLYFGILALLFGAVGSVIFAFLISFVRHCRKNRRSAAVEIAQNLKSMDVNSRIIAKATGLQVEEIELLPESRLVD